MIKVNKILSFLLYKTEIISIFSAMKRISPSGDNFIEFLNIQQMIVKDTKQMIRYVRLVS
ncbi:hypothetical protein BACCOP_00629 [Phocaeicola coprocola DSM 17136]|uniref:Uncharacterized protein n=1 Tax=Phocaeicola coprocola DSM 17136 TaxID=470145 RepID=B3JFI0_9BACT|nr:hypothetical protein BACCOP_00629 [Phocaeicola coprocola DSM 17136]